MVLCTHRVRIPHPPQPPWEGIVKPNLSIMADEKIFANGFSFTRRENAPEWHIGRVLCKKEDAIAFLREQEGEWVGLNINIGRSGKAYLELDTFVPKQKENASEGTAGPKKEQPAPKQETPAPDDDTDDLPF
jgi:hypothetical protein